MNGNSDTETPRIWVQAGRYLACYGIWFLVCGLGLWMIFLFRTNLVEDILFMQLNPWQLRSVDRWALWLMGAVWIFLVFLSEGYLRGATERGRLWQAAARVLGIQALLIGLSFALHYL